MTSMFCRFLLLAVALTGIALNSGTARADSPIARDLPPGFQIPKAAEPGADFDVVKATDAYINLLSPEQRKLSDAYFEGGYWLQLWSLLYTLGVCVLLLFSGVSQRMRTFAERCSSRKWLSTPIYMVEFVMVSFVLNLPLTIYEGFLREHQYGLSEQSFGGWTGDQAKGLAVTLILGTLALSLLYAALRRAGARWWIWATGLAFAFIVLVALVGPVFLEPLFNKYESLPDGPVREAVLSLARANAIPTEHVELFDASKQTTRVSANVAGLFSTTRIALNDNLLNKTSLPEIKAVLAHEMGHYVLNHVWKGIIYFTVVFGCAFALLSYLFDGALARWGRGLQLKDRADPAALPLALALVSLIFFVLTPVMNSITRTMEIEADAFGYNAAREPQAFALVAMRLSTYRKIKPGPIEEFVFYDHPSGYARVHAAMVWFKENQSAVPPEAEIATPTAAKPAG